MAHCVWLKDAGDIVLKNNNKGMPYLDLKEFEAEAARSLSCRLYKGTWKALPSVKWRKHKGLERRKECWGIPPTATSGNGTWRHDI